MAEITRRRAQVAFLNAHHHLINPRLYTENQRQAMDHALLVASWERQTMAPQYVVKTYGTTEMFAIDRGTV